uniref:WW domain-containing protein n=2 Tax=Ciona intestinalis TaxID=7719 RepID=F6UMH0_CIOIN
MQQLQLQQQILQEQNLIQQQMLQNQLQPLTLQTQLAQQNLQIRLQQLQLQQQALQQQSTQPQALQQVIQPSQPIIDAPTPAAQSAFNPPTASPPYEVQPPAKPASPPRDPRPPRLPRNWKSATDAEGSVYYYHVITRKTQWEAPSWDAVDDEETLVKKPSEATNSVNDGKQKPSENAAGSITEEAKKAREAFRSKMSQHIVYCLNSYRKPECKIGRITSTEDFKRLARKLTHNVLMKEIKQVIVWEDLEYNANVKHKAKEYVKKYMAKMGPIYKARDDDEKTER